MAASSQNPLIPGPTLSYITDAPHPWLLLSPWPSLAHPHISEHEGGQGVGIYGSLSAPGEAREGPRTGRHGISLKSRFGGFGVP